MPTEGKGPIVIPCYLKDGVPYVLEVDANGKLAVRAVQIETLLAGGLPAALDSGALKVREQATLTVQAAGGDKIISLESIVADFSYNLDLAAGAIAHPSSSVPTGKVWRITSLSWNYTGTPPGRVLLNVYVSGQDYIIREWQIPVSAQYYDIQTDIWLAAGAVIRLIFLNATLHNGCQLYLLGSQMDAP